MSGPISATSSTTSTTPNVARYDYNHDGVVNHDDVTYFISLMNKGSNAAELLNFQKDNPGDVTIQDLLDFQAKGGTLTGSDIDLFVGQGGTLTQGDIDALVKAGVHFTAADLETINSKLGTSFTAGYAPGTTPADLIKYAQSGEKITVQQLLSLKGPDGKTLATGDDLVKLRQLGTDVKLDDLLALQNAGGVLTGAQVASLVSMGLKLSTSDLATLSKGGMTIKGSELATIFRTQGLTLTKDDYIAINPLSDKTGLPSFQNGVPTDPSVYIEMAKAGLPVTAADMIALKGPDGKPMATDNDLVLLKQAGGTVTAADVIAFQQTGGTVHSGALVMLVNAGMPITSTDLVTLAKGGTTFVDSELKDITSRAGITLTLDEYKAINPIGYTTGKPLFQDGAALTPADIITLAKSGVKVSAQDMLGIKGPDGKPLATENDLILLKQAGGTVTSADVLAYQQAGGTVHAGALQLLVNAGMPLTSSDLLALAKGGMTTNTDELKSILNKAGIRLTLDEYKTINPIGYTTGQPVFQDGVPLKGSDYVAMAQAGVQISSQNLIDLAKAGGVVTSGDVAALADSGSVYFSGDDLVALGAAGVRYDRGDLMHILERTGTVLTNDQANAIAPYLIG